MGYIGSGFKFSKSLRKVIERLKRGYKGFIGKGIKRCMKKGVAVITAVAVGALSGCGYVSKDFSQRVYLTTSWQLSRELCLEF